MGEEVLKSVDSQVPAPVWMKLDECDNERAKYASTMVHVFQESPTLICVHHGKAMVPF